MEYSQSQLQDLQQVETNILKTFIDACDKLNLKYWICGGTLLGAIRHKGFIPWDDDIDVYMPRVDFEKFISEGQKLFSNQYFIQSYHTKKEYPRTYAKLCDSQTTFVESIHRYYDINHGAFVDIFPLDNYCADEKDKKRLYNKKKRLLRCIDKNFFREGKAEKVRSVIKKIVYPMPANVAVKKLDNLFKSVKYSGYYINYMSPYGEKEVYPAEYFLESVDVEFNGLMVKAPKEYHKILTKVYGDYMQLPPEEKRKTHHNFIIVDMHKPYKEYFKK